MHFSVVRVQALLSKNVSCNFKSVQNIYVKNTHCQKCDQKQKVLNKKKCTLEKNVFFKFCSFYSFEAFRS